MTYKQHFLLQISLFCCAATFFASGAVQRHKDCFGISDLCDPTSLTNPVKVESGFVNNAGCSTAPEGTLCVALETVPPSPVVKVSSEFWVLVQDPLSKDYLNFEGDHISVYRETNASSFELVTTISHREFGLISPTAIHAVYRNNPVSGKAERIFLFDHNTGHCVMKLTLPAPFSHTNLCSNSNDCMINPNGTEFTNIAVEYTYTNASFEVLVGTCDVLGSDDAHLHYPYLSVDEATLDLYIADRFNNRVLRVPYENATDSYGAMSVLVQLPRGCSGLNVPLHAVRDPFSGHLFVADLENNQVVMARANASSPTGFNNEAIPIVGSSACALGYDLDSLAFPHHLLIDPVSTDLLVLEYLGHTVKRFRRLPGDPTLTLTPFQREGYLVAGTPGRFSPDALGFVGTMWFAPAERNIYIPSNQPTRLVRVALPVSQIESHFGTCFGGTCRRL
eukprot:GCRY01001432.1.p1 GENE.GCRY01001432.1~~GCRY01001432.1.p1  ORF type:complete len:449 (-),score=80.65 GCRY01001432.1:102-1448(-)